MIIPAYFHEAGVPKTGLSPTVDIYRVSDNSLVVNDGAMTEVGGGFYKYDFAGYDSAQDYLYVVDGTATLANAYRYIPGATNVDGSVADILIDTGTTLDTKLNTIDDYLDTELAAITAAVITNAAGVDIAADIIALKAETAAILEDTGTTLPTAIADVPTVAEFEARTIVAANYLVEGDTLARVTLVDTCTVNSDMRGTDSAALASVCTEGRLAELDAANLPADIDGIKTKTTNLPSDPADQSAVEAAITAATSPLATAVAVADLPTNAELAVALAAADDAVLAAIAALNNLSSAGAQAAAAAALAAYGAALQTSVDDLESRLTAARAGYLDNLSAGAVATAAALDAVDNYVDSEVAAIKAVTDKLDTALVQDGAVYDFTAAALAAAPTGGSAPTVTQIRQEIDANSTQLAAIVADTNELQADWHDGGRLDLLLDAASVGGDPWSTALPGAYGAGTAGKIIGDNVNAPISTVDTVVDAIKAKTDNLPSDPADQSAVEAAITAATSPLATAVAVAALPTTAQINAEVVDALNVDTYAEPGQEAPGATLSLAKKIGYLFKSWRNKGTQTATEMKLYSDDGLTVDQKATVSDDAVTFTREKMNTGA